MAAALALACVARRWYRGVAPVARSVPAAAAITEFLLKPLIGRLSYGSLSFPSGHTIGVFAVAAAVTVLLLARPGGRAATRTGMASPAAATSIRSDYRACVRRATTNTRRNASTVPYGARG